MQGRSRDSASFRKNRREKPNESTRFRQNSLLGRTGKFFRRAGNSNSLLGRKQGYLAPCSRVTQPAPLQWAIFSSARLVVRGPKIPIVAITIAIAAAMKTKTPKAPNLSSTKAMTKEEKMTESRLQE